MDSRCNHELVVQFVFVRKLSLKRNQNLHHSHPRTPVEDK